MCAVHGQRMRPVKETACDTCVTVIQFRLLSSELYLQKPSGHDECHMHASLVFKHGVTVCNF